MTVETLTVEAPSVAAFAHVLEDLDHETRATVTATEQGTPWATVGVSPMTDSHRSVFPAHPDGVRGDTSKRGQSGVVLGRFTPHNNQHALRVVIERAIRMRN